ncbi:MAG TPA: GTPase ObgE [Actinomycetota bacterium]|nr:GTPase ObgE [Actinomycetota bacterium]
MSRSGDFVDEAVVIVKGGDGGNGVASYRREKYRPKGGPDGGNGGNGGNVVFRADPNIGTLSELARHPHQRAPRGQHGRGDDKHGANAPDLVLLVPEGTVVTDASTGEVVADLVRAPAEAIVARGGQGGRGNASLVSRARRAPGFAERGEVVEERTVRLELRVLADVGLVGLPNAGKSSLIARLSAARPKVAAYPFTTLTPHLGVAETEDGRFIVADIPGLIEGAADGRGLGHAFLRHLERCLVLCYVIDVGSEDAEPAEAYRALRDELEAYDPAMAARASVVAANKSDLDGASERAEELRAALPAGTRMIKASALTGQGTEEIHEMLAAAVASAREVEEPVADAHTMIKITPSSDKVHVVREDDGAFRVISDKAERLVARFDLDNDDAVAYLQERFSTLGVEDALTKAGAVEGDEVRIGDAVFDFLPEHVS